MRLEDIARLAQVSKSAVSLALSGKPGIGPETRERILTISRDMGYKTKNKAPVAQWQPTRSLLFLAIANAGIVTDHYSQQPFFRELIHFVEEKCRSLGFSLIISAIDMNRFERDLQATAERHADKGVLLLGTNLTKEGLGRIADRLPWLVVLDTCFETLPISFVEINNAMGGYRAGSYMVESGHRSIGYIASQSRIRNFDARKRGFADALLERGLSLPEDLQFSVDPMIPAAQEELKRGLERLTKTRGKLPTAFFCESDYMAICAIKTLAELGVRVPEEVSVIGFDNIKEAIIVSPELTTLHVDKEKIAAIAVELLAEALERPGGSPVKVAVDTKLVERLSFRALSAEEQGINNGF